MEMIKERILEKLNSKVDKTKIDAYIDIINNYKKVESMNLLSIVLGGRYGL